MLKNSKINVPDLVWMQIGSIVSVVECLVACPVATLTVEHMCYY
jgi:hypothetical protein